MFVRSRLVLFVLTLALGSLVAPTPRAEAQYDSWSLSSGGSWDIGGVIVPMIVVGSVIGVAEAVLIGADLYSWIAGTPFDDGWAVVDLVVGSLWTIAAATVIALYAGVENFDGVVGASPTGFALGALHIAHGAWSLATNAPPPPPIAPAVAISAEGATFTLAGSF